METMKIKTVDENMQMMVIASVAFEANRQYCEMIGGKAFNPAWTEVDQSVRDSLIEAVKVALTDKIVSAELSHLRWMNVRIEQGWSFGPRLDPHRKTHPNLVPFRELSVQEQLKDILFLAIVNSLGAALGYREFDDDGLSREDIQEHQETMSDLETNATGKTDFVPAGEGDGKPIGEVDTPGPGMEVGAGPEDPGNQEKPDEEFQTRQEEFHNDKRKDEEQEEDLKERGAKFMDTIEKPPSPGTDDETKLAVAPEAGETAEPKPNVPAGEVSESSEPTTTAPLPGTAGDQNPKGSVSEPPLPDQDPVDHKATEEKTADRISKAVKAAKKK